MVLLAIAWSIPISFALRFGLPVNATTLDTKTPWLVMLLPEGWGFFTRDPREPDVFAYFRSETGMWQLHRQWNLGFDRSGRTTSIESGALFRQIEDALADCRDAHTACLEAVVSVRVLESPHISSRLCGDIGFVVQEPTPWAWASAKVMMPSRVARIRVRC